MTSPLRWELKKAARRAMALGSWATGAAGSVEASRGGPWVRVLTYHRFGAVARDPFCVSPRRFETQMRHLADRGLAVSLDDLLRVVARGAAAPPGAVLVTIDDGFRSLYETALPVLSRYGIPAVAFVTAGLVGSRDKGPARAAAAEGYLSWDELSRLARANVAVGSHSWTHRSLGRMSPAEIEDEAARSRETLEARCGAPVTAFAYPFGTVADFDAEAASILRRTGYSCAFTSQHGAVRAGMEPFSLPRVKVEGGDDLWLFRLLVRGGLDGWRWVDRNLWRLQATDREAGGGNRHASTTAGWGASRGAFERSERSR